VKKAIILSFLFVNYLSFGQATKKYSNEFMSIGVDARAMGMTNAVTANTDNVNAGYWNPAGLLYIKDSEIALMHASYFANIAKYDYAAFAMKIDNKSAFGLSVIRFGVDDIMNTTQLIDSQGNIDYNRISLFSAADYGVTFSYARSTEIDGLTYGANAKVIRRIIGKFATSWGFGFDFGAQYRTKNNWQFGIMLRDITTTYNTWAINEKEYQKIKDAVPGENQEIPETTEITLPKAQLGISKKMLYNNEYSFLVSANLNMQFAKTNDIISSNAVSIDPAVGFEIGYTNLVYLRGGVGNFQNITTIDNTQKLNFQPNFGVGFHYKGIAVDYALTNVGKQSAALYSNIFSLRVDLGIFK
jgi:hypothetical protein